MMHGPRPLPHVRNPSRSASPSIAGYHYQFAHAALLWLDCDENSVLYCEANEDIDKIDSAGAVNEVQVKKLSSTIGQTSDHVRKTLKNFAQAFCEHHQAGRPCTLSWYSTAELAGPEDTALSAWMRGEQFVLTDLQKSIEGLDAIEPQAHEYLGQLGAWEAFFNSVHWAFGQAGLAEAEVRLAERLAADPRVAGLSPENTRDEMLAYILRASGQPSLPERALTSIQLDILLNDLWLNKDVDEFRLTAVNTERAYIALVRRDPKSVACVALLLDDEERSEAAFRACREHLENQPRSFSANSLEQMLEHADGERFIAGLGFDVYAVVHVATGSGVASSDREMTRNLEGYLEARKVERVSVATQDDFATMNALLAQHAVEVDHSMSLGSQIARCVGRAVLDSWLQQAIQPLISSVHRKMRVIVDLESRDYFTQAHPCRWV